MRFFPALLLLVLLMANSAAGQDTLPRFSAVIKANGKIVLSWHNSYPVVNQISIQRSKDSLKNFTTILTVPDPTIPENGFESRSLLPGLISQHRVHWWRINNLVGIKNIIRVPGVFNYCK